MSRASYNYAPSKKAYPIRHNTRIQSLPYQHQSSVKVLPHQNGCQQQQRLREDISAEQLQSQTFHENMQTEKITSTQQLSNQNHLQKNSNFIQMPVKQEFCPERRSILEAQMYDNSVTQTQAEQITHYDSVSYLQQVQPTYFTSEQATFTNCNGPYRKTEDFPNNQQTISGLKSEPKNQIYLRSVSQNLEKSFCSQPYYNQAQNFKNFHQNQHASYSQESTFSNHQQHQLVTQSPYYMSHYTYNNQMLPNQQVYNCGSFQEENFLDQRYETIRAL